MLTRQVLQEDRGIQDQVPAAAECRKTYEKSQNRPVRRGAGDDGEDAGDHEGDVEGVFAAYDVGREAPEEGADEHADVGGDCEAVGEGRVEFVARICGDDGLD